LRVLTARGLDAPGLGRGKSAATARETIYVPDSWGLISAFRRCPTVEEAAS